MYIHFLLFDITTMHLPVILFQQPIIHQNYEK